MHPRETVGYVLMGWNPTSNQDEFVREYDTYRPDSEFHGVHFTTDIADAMMWNEGSKAAEKMFTIMNVTDHPYIYISRVFARTAFKVNLGHGFQNVVDE